MKIDQQRVLPQNLFSQGKEKPAFFAFEQWLKYPKIDKKADEYYWLHQHQLQDSALQFELFIQKKQTARGELNRSLEQCNPFESESFLEKSPLFTSQAKSDRLEQPLTACRLQYEFSKIITKSQQRLNSLIPNQATRSISSKPNSLITTQPFGCKENIHHFTFKNYQLFIQANVAELSLNGTELSIHQIKELIESIKKWLWSKGLRLQHLVINGEKQ